MGLRGCATKLRPVTKKRASPIPAQCDPIRCARSTGKTPSTVERLTPTFSKVFPSESTRLTPPPPPWRSQESSRKSPPASSSVKSRVMPSCRCSIRAATSDRKSVCMIPDSLPLPNRIDECLGMFNGNVGQNSVPQVCDMAPATKCLQHQVSTLANRCGGGIEPAGIQIPLQRHHRCRQPLPGFRCIGLPIDPNHLCSGLLRYLLQCPPGTRSKHDDGYACSSRQPDGFA